MYISAEHLALVTRKLFSDDDGKSSNHTCPTQYDPHYQIQPFVGSMTYHTFATILSGACGIVSILLALITVLNHATHYSAPMQQRQIIRIACLIPWVSIVSFLCVWVDSATLYLIPALDVGCAIAISAFLLLLCDYILANPNGFDDLFGAGASAQGQFASTSPTGLKRTWYTVLQFLPIMIIVWIAQAASLAAGTYCETSSKPYFAKLWIEIIRSISTTLAILAVLRFAKIHKTHLAPHKVIFKLVAFKSIIGLNFLQTFIFNILVSHQVIKPSHILTLNDLNALPSLILAVEMPLFSVVVYLAYNVTPYKSTNKGGSFYGGPLGVKAIFHALNPADILGAYFRGPMRLVRGQSGQFGENEGVPLTAPPAYGQNSTYNAGYTYVREESPEARYGA